MLRYLKRLFTRSTPSDGSTLPTESTTDLLTPQYKGAAPRKYWEQYQYAFTSGGVHYFYLPNNINIPFERQNGAIDIYRQVQFSINPDVLRASFSNILHAVRSDKKGYADRARLDDISKIASGMLERVDLVISPELSVRLATVYYVDEIENPFAYDHTYNQKKIEHWAKHQDVPAFFLNLPHQQLTTSTKELQESLSTFLEGETIMNLKILEALTTGPASQSISEDLRKTLDLQKQDQLLLNNWSRGLTTNTT